MAPLRALPLSIFAIFLFVADKPDVAASVKVFLGEPFAFPKNCQAGETGSLRHRFIPDKTVEVAHFEAGVWTACSGYTDRIRRNSSIVFDRVVFNDNGGTHELTCEDERGGKREEIVQLEVSPYTVYVVSEGGTAILPCHFITTGKTGLIVRWERDGKVLWEKKLGSHEEEQASSRIYVSPAGFSDGNLSLIIDRVQMDDQGFYSCSVRDDEEADYQPGNPAVIKMTVSKKQVLFSYTSPAPTQSQEEKYWFAGGIVLGFGLCAVLILPGWWCCRHSCRSSSL